jgi:hypothetical protein
MSEAAMSSDRIQSILDDLIRQRRSWSAGGAEPGLLEANRLGIVYWRLQLARLASAERRAEDTAA